MPTLLGIYFNAITARRGHIKLGSGFVDEEGDIPPSLRPAQTSLHAKLLAGIGEIRAGAPPCLLYKTTREHPSPTLSQVGPTVSRSTTCTRSDLIPLLYLPRTVFSSGLLSFAGCNQDHTAPVAGSLLAVCPQVCDRSALCYVTQVGVATSTTTGAKMKLRRRAPRQQQAERCDDEHHDSNKLRDDEHHDSDKLCDHEHHDSCKLYDHEHHDSNKLDDDEHHDSNKHPSRGIISTISDGCFHSCNISRVPLRPTPPTPRELETPTHPHQRQRSRSRAKERGAVGLGKKGAGSSSQRSESLAIDRQPTCRPSLKPVALV